MERVEAGETVDTKKDCKHAGLARTVRKARGKASASAAKVVEGPVLVVAIH
jgi:hypothetical protein